MKIDVVLLVLSLCYVTQWSSVLGKPQLHDNNIYFYVKSPHFYYHPEQSEHGKRLNKHESESGSSEGDGSSLDEEHEPQVESHVSRRHHEMEHENEDEGDYGSQNYGEPNPFRKHHGGKIPDSDNNYYDDDDDYYDDDQDQEYGNHDHSNNYDDDQDESWHALGKKKGESAHHSFYFFHKGPNGETHHGHLHVNHPPKRD